MFSIGMKVVCVDDSTWQGFGYIKRDGIYTVATVFIRGHSERLELIEAPSIMRVGYYSFRFRPLTDQKKSVSFTAGAPDDSERWDNRRKVVEHAAALRAIEAHRGQQ